MNKFPKWFWISIVSYVILTWTFPLIAHFSSDFLRVNFEWYVGYAIFYFGILAYPAFLAVMLLSTFRKVDLNSDEKVWAFLFLLIPLATNLPILNPLIIFV